jgi:hypothetical protein
MFIGEEELPLDCKTRWRVRGDLRGGKRWRHVQFSNSNKASLCRSLMDTRDSRLLIVDSGEQAETVR